MKNKSLIILLITLLSILVIGLTIFMINMLNGNFKFRNFNFSHKVSNELVVDEVYDNMFDKIKIKTNASDIYIKESTTNEIKVTVYGDKDNTKVNINNNELLIELKEKPCIGFCFNIKISKIEIYIPSANKGILDIKNNYGDVEIDKFLNMDIIVDEDCGDVNILGANKADINNNYGNVDLKQVNVANIETASGNTKVGIVNDITIKNDYGNVLIDKVNNFIDIKEDCGDVEINSIKINKDSSIKNDFGNIEIGSTNEIYIDASTDLGKVKINKNYKKSDITLKIENDCGDIEIDN